MKVERRKKIINISLLGILILSLFITVLPVNAYSTETTGVKTTGFETNQQTFVKIGSHNIFAFDNMLIDYDDNAVLSATFTLPEFGNNTWEGSYSQWNIANADKTAIIALNDTYILVARVRFDGYTWSVYKNHIQYEFGVYNINSHAYTAYYSGFKLFYSATGNSQSNFNTGVLILKNTNDTGTFFYGWFSAYARYNAGDMGACDIFSYIGNVNIVGAQTWGFKQYYYVTYTDYASTLLKNTNLVVPSEQSPLNYRFVITANGWTSGNRANIYMVKFEAPFTISYIGVTPYDYSYTSQWSQGNPSLVYAFGWGSNNGLIQLNFVFGTPTVTGLTVETIQFNTTHVFSSNHNLGLSSGSTPIRPFTVGWSAGNGNISTTYTIAWFDDIFENWALTGWSDRLQNLEINTPTWTTNQFGFLFTPQSPQTWAYPTSNNWGGFQPIGSNVGCFVDMQNGKVKANPMVSVNTQITFMGTLTGGIFTGRTSIAQHPTQITLQQGITYKYEGWLYQNGVLNLNGTYSVLATDLSAYTSTFTSRTYTTNLGGDISKGYFTFNFAPITSNGVTYRAIMVNFTTTDGTALSYLYDFGFYGYGDADSNGSIPFPNTGGTDEIPSGIGGGGGAFNPTMTVSPIFWAGLVLTIVFALMFAYIAGADGLLAGLVIGIALSCAFGLFPIWLVIIDIILGALLVLSKTGVIGGR